MLIDWHVHIHDIKDQVNPYWKGKCPMTPENVLAAHKLAIAEVPVMVAAGWSEAQKRAYCWPTTSWR